MNPQNNKRRWNASSTPNNNNNKRQRINETQPQYPQNTNNNTTNINNRGGYAFHWRGRGRGRGRVNIRGMRNRGGMRGRAMKIRGRGNPRGLSARGMRMRGRGNYRGLSARGMKMRGRGNSRGMIARGMKIRGRGMSARAMKIRGRGNIRGMNARGNSIPTITIQNLPNLNMNSTSILPFGSTQIFPNNNNTFNISPFSNSFKNNPAEMLNPLPNTPFNYPSSTTNIQRVNVFANFGSSPNTTVNETEKSPEIAITTKTITANAKITNDIQLADMRRKVLASMNSMSTTKKVNDDEKKNESTIHQQITDAKAKIDSQSISVQQKQLENKKILALRVARFKILQRRKNNNKSNVNLKKTMTAPMMKTVIAPMVKTVTALKTTTASMVKSTRNISKNVPISQPKPMLKPVTLPKPQSMQIKAHPPLVKIQKQTSDKNNQIIENVEQQNMKFSEIRAIYKQKFIEIYTKVNPSKLSNMELYIKGTSVQKLHKIYLRICHKYQLPIENIINSESTTKKCTTVGYDVQPEIMNEEKIVNEEKAEKSISTPLEMYSCHWCKGVWEEVKSIHDRQLLCDPRSICGICGRNVNNIAVIWHCHSCKKDMCSNCFDMIRESLKRKLKNIQKKKNDNNLLGNVKIEEKEHLEVENIVAYPILSNCWKSDDVNFSYESFFSELDDYIHEVSEEMKIGDEIIDDVNDDSIDGESLMNDLEWIKKCYKDFGLDIVNENENLDIEQFEIFLKNM